MAPIVGTIAKEAAVFNGPFLCLAMEECKPLRSLITSILIIIHHKKSFYKFLFYRTLIK